MAATISSVVNQDTHSFTVLVADGNGGFANPAAWARHIDQRRYEHQRPPGRDRGGRL